MMSGAKVLVAGGSGLVGANLTQRLVHDGAKVLSTFTTRPPQLLREAYRQYDFTQFDDCLEATRDRDIVFLCAAQIGGAKTMREQPTQFMLPNLEINAGLFEACSRNGVGKVVFVSSSTVYQLASHPIREDELDLNQPPFELYFGVGWLNRYLEKLAAFYRQTRGIQVEVLRPTNIYGPHDHFEDDRAHVLPALINRALRRENPFVVWGDGTAVRNFIYVDDFVDDLLLVAGKDCGGEPLNVAGDRDLTIRQAVREVLDATNHPVEPEYDASKPTAIPYRALNTNRFVGIFGPRKRTPFEEGVRRTVEWRRQQMNHSLS
jgi:GDP-L-fucose synthase